jgi:hypothetical protein
MRPTANVTSQMDQLWSETQLATGIPHKTVRSSIAERKMARSHIESATAARSSASLGELPRDSNQSASDFMRSRYILVIQTCTHSPEVDHSPPSAAIGFDQVYPSSQCPHLGRASVRGRRVLDWQPWRTGKAPVSSPISNSTHKRTDYYTFFFHWAIDRRSAISAVVAGTVAGGLLTAVFLLSFLGRMASQGWRFPSSAVLLGAAMGAACATYATWKHFVIGPLITLVLGASLSWWVAMDLHDPAMAVIVAVPLLGGSITATRGIMVLNSPKGFEPIASEGVGRGHK